MILFWIFTLLSFGFYTYMTFLEVGFMGFFPPVHEQATMQVFLDLFISGLVAIYLMYDRRKRHKRSIRPVVLTMIGFCLFGSQALLIYMIYDWITQKEKPSQRDMSAF
jgi:hypothetical protein